MMRNPPAMNRQAASLTKRVDWCKRSILIALIGCTIPVAATELRECVASARDATAINACEQAAQARLGLRIQALNADIQKRLDPARRGLFERNVLAWQAFLASETALLDLTMAARADGLADRLRAGAVTQLYETRERQLREHLHNLSGRAAPNPR